MLDCTLLLDSASQFGLKEGFKYPYGTQGNLWVTLFASCLHQIVLNLLH